VENTEITAIIFDCFGVLTTDTWRAFLDKLPPETDTDRARELNRQLNSGLIDHADFVQQIRELTGKDIVEIENVAKSEISKNEVLLNYIRELKERGYKLAIMSNIASNWIRDTFLTPEEIELFDEMIFSYEVGMTKPDPRIFMLACERLRVSAHEAVMIDDIESYVEAAKAEGMAGIVYNDFVQMKSELEAIL
jgi:epoxide hydrolase-like predicted phosphatase